MCWKNLTECVLRWETFCNTSPEFVEIMQADGRQDYDKFKEKREKDLKEFVDQMLKLAKDNRPVVNSIKKLQSEYKWRRIVYERTHLGNQREILDCSKRPLLGCRLRCLEGMEVAGVSQQKKEGVHFFECAPAAVAASPWISVSESSEHQRRTPGDIRVATSHCCETRCIVSPLRPGSCVQPLHLVLRRRPAPWTGPPHRLQAISCEKSFLLKNMFSNLYGSVTDP